MIVKNTTPQDAPFVRGKLRFGLIADGEFGLSTGQIDPALGNQLVTVTYALLHSRGPEHMSLQALAHVVVSIGYSPLFGVIVEQGMSKSAFPMAMSDAIVGCARETGRPRLLEIATHIHTPGGALGQTRYFLRESAKLVSP